MFKKTKNKNPYILVYLFILITYHKHLFIYETDNETSGYCVESNLEKILEKIK